MTLELLLARAGDGQPVLRKGLAEDTLLGAPPPGRGEVPERLWDPNSDPNDLSKQRWGVVAPKGPAGERLLELIEPLRQVREEAQGSPVTVYRLPEKVTEEMDGPWAMSWKKEYFRQESKSEASLPRYLLLLGDLHQIPLEFQQVMATDAFVGRLSFRSEAGYRAYVEKVLRWEQLSPSQQKARMLFYSSRDGSGATDSGYQGLMAPSVSACLRGQRLREFPPAEILEMGSEGAVPAEQLLAWAEEGGGSVLFSMSHGAAGSAEDRRDLQGALLFPGGRLLTGKEVASRPFLPGGLWFFFACFSAGTPTRSAYAHWIEQLHAHAPEMVELISASLLPKGEPPFIAALPQAALANPEGPLGVIGHVDLAWSFGYKDHGRPTPSRFLSVLEVLAKGGRAGVALNALQRYVNETSVELTMLQNEEQRARSERLPSPIEPVKWAELWMVRQDLSNYILLGDPAARLPLAPAAQEPVPRAVPAPGRRSSAGPAVAEKAVLDLLSGRALSSVADRHGVSTQELREWEELFRAAGREALNRHFSSKA